MNENNHTHTTTAGASVHRGTTVVQENLQHVSWGAIILALVIVIGLQILFGLLGLGLGLTMLDPADPMGGIGSWTIGSSIYFIFVQIVSLFIGGYVAARLTRAPTAESAMFHGASIWALAAIVMVWLGTTSVGMAISGLSGAVSGIASATSQAVKAVVPDDLGSIDLPEVNYSMLPEPVRDTLRENNITADALQQEVRAAYRQVVSRQEQQQLMQELQETVKEVLQDPSEALENIDQAIDDAFGQGGVLSQEDLSEMQNTLQRRLNLSDQEVQQIVNQLQQSVEQARSEIKQALKSAKQQSVEAATAVTDKMGSVALWMFFASVLGLIAAVLGGKKGEVPVREVPIR